MGLIAPAPVQPLIYVEKDAEYVRVRRRGRYSVEYACAESPAHRDAAIQEACGLMISGLKRLGYEHTGEPFQFSSWEPHMEFSADATADPSPGAMPDPRDADALACWERAEKARTARRLGLSDDQEHELVDFVITSTFTKRLSRNFRVHIPEAR